MKRAIKMSVFLIVVLTSRAAPQGPTLKPGDRVQIRVQYEHCPVATCVGPRRTIVGNIDSTGPDTLWIRVGSRQIEPVPYRLASSIAVSDGKKPSPVNGAIAGGGLGAIVGLIANVIAGPTERRRCRTLLGQCSTTPITAVERATVGAAGGLVLGALAGALILNRVLPTDDWRRIDAHGPQLTVATGSRFATGITVPF